MSYTIIIIVVVIMTLLSSVGAFVYIYLEHPQLLGMPENCKATGGFGEFQECKDGKTTRIKPYDGENYAHCGYSETKDCSEVEKDCKYTDWVYGTADTDGKVSKTRTLESGPEKICTELTGIESCEYGEYGEMSEHDPETGVKTQLRSLISGPITSCLDLIKSISYNTIELNVKKIVGNNKVSVGVIGDDDKLVWLKNPLSLVVGKNNVFTDITPKKIRIYYTDGGDIYLEDIKYNGVSVMATGSGSKADGAKAGTLFWKDDYDYTINPTEPDTDITDNTVDNS